MDYHWIKLLHLLGATIFLGNIFVTVVWKIAADRSGDAVVIAFSQGLVTLTDLLFTTAGALLVLATGTILTLSTPGLEEQSWVIWGFRLFAASGSLWTLLAIPLQVQQGRIAGNLRPGAAIPEDYRRLARWWYLVGAVAILLALVDLYLMVLRPAF